MKKSLFYWMFLSMSAVFAAVPEFLVVSNNPSRLEKMAEQEIKIFYEKLYSKQLKTIAEKDAAGKSVIYLGNTAAARKNGFEQSKFAKEEWMLKSVDDDLIIAGGIPAGTIYGVYEWAERLGVVFAAPDETYFPSKPAFPNFNEKRKPAVAGRLIWDSIYGPMKASKVPEKSIEAYRLWILRNRINGQPSNDLKAYYCGDYYNLSTYPYHNLCWYVNPKKYFKDHPEYFMMDAFGKRQRPRSMSVNGGLCMSNPKVAEITIESLRNFIKRDRAAYPKGEHPVVYDISELDATPTTCLCPECRKISEAGGSDRDLVFFYINRVAREIRKEYPDVIIRTSTRVRKPGKIKPEKNVFVRVAHSFSSINPFYPYDPAQTVGSRNEEKQRIFDMWVKAVDSLQMWDYWNLGNNYFTPPRIETVFDAIQPDLKYFIKNKIVCIFYEASLDSASPQNFMMLNYFTAQHLMVNPDMDAEKLADDFLKAYYGPCYPVAKKYFNLIRKGVKESKQTSATSMSVGHWKYVTPEFLVNMYQDLHKAERALPANDRFAKRIRHEIITPIWYALANWHNYGKEFKKINITHEQLVKECRTLINEYMCRYGATDLKKILPKYQKRFERAVRIFPRPAKFKNVPEADFRMITGHSFRGVGNLHSFIVNDAESEVGRANIVRNPQIAFHGVNKRLPGKHKFYSTEFVLNGYPDSVGTILKQVAQDEKYHWYRLPGNIELRDKTTFWGHGWSFQARPNYWYTLTDGNPLDNLWSQVWMSAKFTGPAYVPGSTKPNAIYVDRVVIVRNVKDNEFKKIPAYSVKTFKEGKLPADWNGKASVVSTAKSKALKLTGNVSVRGPKFNCTKDDVIIVKTRSKGTGTVMLALYGKDGKIFRRKAVNTVDNFLQNVHVFQVSDMRGSSNVQQAAVVVSNGKGELQLEDFEVEIAEKFNCDFKNDGKEVNP